MYDNARSFQITNAISFLGEVTRNMFLEFERCAKKFISIEKYGKDISILKDIRIIMTECKQELCKIRIKYYEISRINENLLNIIKGEIDPLITSYNCSVKRTNKKTGISYEFIVPEEDKVILNASSTDDGFAEAMVKCAAIENPRDKIIFLSSLVKTTREEYQNIDRKIDKLNERIELANDNTLPEYQISIKKRASLRNSQKIINDRLRMILQMFFAIRKQMVKNIVEVSNPFISLFPNGNEDMRQLSLKHSVKRDLEDLLSIETLLNKSDKRFRVTPILS